MKNSIILTPFFLDQESPGLDLLMVPGWKSNLPSLPDGDRQERMIALYRPLRDLVTEAARQGRRPVSLAGDCCTTLAVAAGLQEAGLDPTLIWFDAHGDFNTWETSPSGFLGGMPLAMLVGRGEMTMARGVGLESLDEAKVILTDGRDLDPGERAALEASAVRHLPSPQMLLDNPLPEGPLYVHFDADILDPEEAPAMSYPAPGGVSVDLLRRVFKRLASTGRVVALSLSAWNPEMAGAGRSEASVMSLIRELIKTNIVLNS